MCLIGIARHIAIDALSLFDQQMYNIQFEQNDITLEQLLAADEVVLCSASIGIFPVIAVNNKPVNNGVIGQFFKKWFLHYHQYLSQNSVTI